MKFNNLSTIRSILYNDLKRGALPTLCALAGLMLIQLLFHRICPISIISGYPCPGCGITRALFYLITFQWKLAFEYNPTIFIWVPIIMWGILSRYLLKDSYLQKQNKKIFIHTVTAVGILSIAVYIVRMIILYPDIPPMTYNPRNIFNILF